MASLREEAVPHWEGEVLWAFVVSPQASQSALVAQAVSSLLGLLLHFLER